MSRGVDESVIPGADIMVGGEIRADYLSDIAISQNTLHEQHRGNLVADYDPTGILDSTGQVARYRPRIEGRAGGTESVEVRLWLFAEDTGAASPTSAQIDVTVDGNVTSWNYSADLLTPTEVTLSTVNCDDSNSAEYVDITVEITDNQGGDVDIEVLGVDVFYERARTTLDAVSSGSLSYDDGFCPSDTVAFDGERPVTPARIYQACDNVAPLYELRVGQAVTMANGAGTAFTASDDAPIGFDTLSPHGTTSMKVWIYVTTATGKLTVSSSIDSVDETSPVSGWNEFELDTLECQREEIRIGGESCIYRHVSAYWTDAVLHEV